MARTFWHPNSSDRAAITRGNEKVALHYFGRTCQYCKARFRAKTMRHTICTDCLPVIRRALLANATRTRKSV